MAEATASSNRLVTALEELVVLLRDAEQEYKHAAEDLKDTDLLSFRLEVLSRERAEGADELDEILRRLDGGSPPEGGSRSGAAHRMWMDLKSAATDGERAPLLQEIYRFESYLEARYGEALENGLRGTAVPDGIARRLRWQHDSVRQARDRSRAMLEGAGARPAWQPEGAVGLVAGSVGGYASARPLATTALIVGLGLLAGLLLAISRRPATGRGGSRTAPAGDPQDLRSLPQDASARAA